MSKMIEAPHRQRERMLFGAPEPQVRDLAPASRRAEALGVLGSAARARPLPFVPVATALYIAPVCNLAA
ncbi:MAG TPA: hypothetical protein VMF90_05625 [Rhizobiaceae bacterium]|nr:hypothetical protein [Rhizobiaceae bacterium]